MKLCKDCKFYRKGIEPQFATCTYPQLVNRVTGEPGRPRWKYCSMQRNESFPFNYIFSMCGKSGRWFQAK